MEFERAGTERLSDIPLPLDRHRVAALMQGGCINHAPETQRSSWLSVLTLNRLPACRAASLLSRSGQHAFHGGNLDLRGLIIALELFV